MNRCAIKITAIFVGLLFTCITVIFFLSSYFIKTKKKEKKRKSPQRRSHYWRTKKKKKTFVRFVFIANEKPVWIVSDVRRKTDVQWFVENFGNACKNIRITADNEVRKKRGWNFISGEVTRMVLKKEIFLQ